jgi:hypothetical protein
MKCWRWPKRINLKSDLANVEFLKGEIENIPLPDNSVDVIISNCVINLSIEAALHYAATPLARLRNIDVGIHRFGVPSRL